MKYIILIAKKVKRLKYLKWILRFVIACILLVIILGIIWYKNLPICDKYHKCNVILVSLDTLSALHLPCYGYERNTAPNLCAYADKNILFLNSYSNAPITLDSHFSIFTSLYPHTHKMTEVLKNPLSEKYLTLAQIFRADGYQTIYHGPINDIHMPLDRGIERGFDTINEGHLENWNEAYLKLIKNTEQNKRTFLFLHTYAVHMPYLPGNNKKRLFTNLPVDPKIPLTWGEYQKTSPEFFLYTVDNILTKGSKAPNGFDKLINKDIQDAKKLQNTKNIVEADSVFDTFSATSKVIYYGQWYNFLLSNKSTEQTEYVKALYDEQIYNMDKKLGNLFALMKDPRLSKNTILIITADHGEEFMEHGNFFHAKNLYASSTRVPLIMHIPGVTPKKIQEMVQGIDIYPTALSLIGLVPKSPIEGLDLAALIKGDKNAKTNKYLRSEFNGITAIQDNNWRLYYEDENKIPRELYNFTTDPGELHNIIYTNPKKVDEIFKLLR